MEWFNKKLGFEFFRNSNKRAEIDSDELIGWILAIAALIIAVVGIFILKSKGINAIDYLKNLFRFGR